jgi:hypothetical protein
MDAVEGEDEHHDEVGYEEAGVKGIGAVEALEGLIGVVGLVVVEQPVLGRQQQKGEQMGRGEQGGYLRARMLVRD